MKRKLLSMLLAATMVATMLVGCGSGSASESASASAGGGKIGVAMPTKDLQRWNQDGSNMEAQLIEAGASSDFVSSVFVSAGAAASSVFPPHPTNSVATIAVARTTLSNFFFIKIYLPLLIGICLQMKHITE